MSRRRIARYRETTIVISDCRSLIPIEAEPIKRAEQKKCKDVIHQMDLARERLRRFSEESEPAFKHWLHSTFGQQITELRELAQKRGELYRLMAEVEEYKSIARCSYHQAYKTIIDKRNQGDAPFQDEEHKENPFGEDSDESDSEAFDEDDDAEMENVLRAGFESMFGPRPQGKSSKAEYDTLYEDFKESFKGTFGPGSFDDDAATRDGPKNGNHRRSNGDERDFRQTLNDFDELDRHSAETSAKEDSRVKTLYRILARRLHPDVNTGLDQKRKDLWHQVQDAYEAKDIDRLETLSAMSEVFDDNAHAVESVWSIKNLYEELRSGLRHLQRQINRCSQDIAWSFEKTKRHPKKLDRLHEKIASQMKADTRELLNHIEYGEEQIERWKNPPPPRKSEPRKKSKNAHVPKPVRDHRQSQWTKAEMDAYTGFGKRGR